MATKVTTRKPQFGQTRSHALNSTKKKRKLNLQNVTVDGIKVRLSTRELRTLNKTDKQAA